MSAAELARWTKDIEQRLGYTPDPDDLRRTAVYRQDAPGGVLYEPSTFDHLIGTDVPVMSDTGVWPGRLKAAHVIEGGAAVELTIDLPIAFAPEIPAGGTR